MEAVTKKNAKNALRSELNEQVMERKADAKAKQAKYYNRTAKDLKDLKERTVVRIKPLTNTKKPWQKATVDKKVGETSHEVTTEDGVSYRRNRRRLKQTREEQNTPSAPQELEVEVQRRNQVQPSNKSHSNTTQEQQSRPSPQEQFQSRPSSQGPQSHPS